MLLRSGTIASMEIHPALRIIVHQIAADCPEGFNVVDYVTPIEVKSLKLEHDELGTCEVENGREAASEQGSSYLFSVVSWH